MNRCISAICAALMLFSLSACSDVNGSGGDQIETPPPGSGSAVIEFDYLEQSGHASNQFAVWIEDADGNLVKTLYATRFTANGGYKIRPDSIFVWADKSELSSMEESQIDAITGATPKTGKLSYTWDLTNTNGDAVLPGEYGVFVEGSLRWKNHVLYSCRIAVGNSPSVIQAQAEYIYESAEGQPGLTSDSPENSMIRNVTVRFIPAAVN